MNVSNGTISYRVGTIDQWCGLLMSSCFLSQFRNQVLYKGVNKTQQQHLRKGNSVKCFVQGIVKLFKWGVLTWGEECSFQRCITQDWLHLVSEVVICS